VQWQHRHSVAEEEREYDRQSYRGEVASAEGCADHHAQHLAFGAVRVAVRRGAEG
jgi:hypothetical protein